MISSATSADPYGDLIDADVDSHQQSQVPQQNTASDNQGYPAGLAPVGGKKATQDTVNTFLGPMPASMPSLQAGTPENKELLHQMLGWAVGAPGLGGAGLVESAIPFAKENAANIANYMQPGKAAEQFRGSLGQGTSAENIQNLSQQVQAAKEAATNEALIPKQQIYAQEGGSNIYKVNPEGLPEKNIPGLAEMIAPGEPYNAKNMAALSDALQSYRKTGDVGLFLDKSEDIFNIPELSEKAASRIEDVLSMPTKRDSSYFSDPNVDSYYANKGNLQQLHDAFEAKSTLNNYDPLQSALKARQRTLNERASQGTITDTGEAELNQLNKNIANLDADQTAFMQTLPENMQGLEKEFRTKYAINVAPYLDAPDVIQKLIEGRSGEVADSDIERTFSKATPEVKKILGDLGDPAKKNILYSALQRVQPGDAEGMAKLLLDLKRTKNFDSFISPEQEAWANNMLKRTSRVGLIKKALSSAGGAAAGGAVYGLPGAIIGGLAPVGYKGAKSIIHFIKK